MIEEELEKAQQELLEKQGQAELGFGFARHLLIKAADEIRQLKSEVAKSSPQYYTEREVAALFKVSESTIERSRKAGKFACIHMGTLIRYAPEHVIEIGKVFEKKAAAAKSRRGPRSAAA